MLGLRLVSWREEDCGRASVTSNLCFHPRPKFWENLTSSLFGTLSPPSETSEVSHGGERDSGCELSVWEERLGYEMELEEMSPSLLITVFSPQEVPFSCLFPLSWHLALGRKVTHCGLGGWLCALLHLFGDTEPDFPVPACWIPIHLP